MRWIFLLVVLMAATGQAREVPIFTGSVALAAGSEASESALAAALQQVLVKASGDRSVAADAARAASLQRAGRLLRAQNIREQLVALPGGGSEHRRVLQAEFDPAGVKALLDELARPLWPADRPSLLVWLVIDNNGSKQIASAFQMAALGALVDTAELRGLPVELPRMDGVDRNRIDAVTLWDAPPNAVVGASQRYGARVLLVARLARNDGGWTARYTLIDGLGFEDWQATAADSAPLLASAIDGAADRLAGRYSVESGDNALGATEVRVDGVDSAEDYALVIDYFRNLGPLRLLGPMRAEADELALQVDVGVGRLRLRQLLERNPRLVWRDPPATAAAAATPILLRLVD